MLRGIVCLFFSLLVPDKVTSAFGVSRECFDFKGSPLFGPSTIETRLPVELNGPKNTSKMIPMIPKSQPTPTMLQGNKGPDYSETRMEDSRKPRPGVGPGCTYYCV